MNIPKTVTTIIWDLDGTLLDSFGVLEDVLAEILPANGYDMPSRDLLLKNFHGSLEDVINNVLPGIKNDKAAAIVKDFLTAQDTYYEKADDHLFPDAVAFAERAHIAGKQQILVTNRSHANRLKASPRSLVENSVLNKFIEVVICGDDSPYRKPKSAVLGDHLIVPAETIVIGDQFVDIEFAHNLGCEAIIVRRDGKALPHQESLSKHALDNAKFIDTLDLLIV